MEKKKDIGLQSIELHRKLGGKIAVVSKKSITTKKDLALLYTPGVGAVSSYIAKRPNRARDITIQRNTVAIVSDGSAVLGLGNIGPEASLPVLEGKAALFKTFANVDAFPIALKTQDSDEIVNIIKNIAPTFGGINLEDISAPRCFEIESKLKKELSIPVMHDDQHGTAIVVLAGLINAFHVVRKDVKKSRIVVVGAGAAGVAITKLLYRFGVRDIVVVDSKGVISDSRRNLNIYKQELIKYNKRNVKGDLNVAMAGADVVIGVSGPKKITSRQVLMMGKDPIIFALANPTPEIFPKEAQKAGARIIATGRSDYPNQVNNSLVFPGVFRGALDNHVRAITDTMKVKAAEALASVVKNPSERKFIPGPFDKGVVKAVSDAIR